ncbi:hypothetical protein, partial [Ruminococcus sp. RTP21484sp1_RTP21281st1_A2_RTP21281_210402]|uniref:hypothetical protein n=1 Tax=unclassified Ruminococcus TaxID=2608920 RepID=UPI0034A3501D
LDSTDGTAGLTPYGKTINVVTFKSHEAIRITMQYYTFHILHILEHLFFLVYYSHFKPECKVVIFTRAFLPPNIGTKLPLLYLKLPQF